MRGLVEWAPTIKKSLTCPYCGTHVDRVYISGQKTCGAPQCQAKCRRDQDMRSRAARKKLADEKRAAKQRGETEKKPQRLPATAYELPGKCFLCGQPREYAKAVCKKAACRGKFNFMVARQVERGRMIHGPEYNELDARAELAWRRMTAGDTGDTRSPYRTTYAQACARAS